MSARGSARRSTALVFRINLQVDPTDGALVNESTTGLCSVDVAIRCVDSCPVVFVRVQVVDADYTPTHLISEKQEVTAIVPVVAEVSSSLKRSSSEL